MYDIVGGTPLKLNVTIQKKTISHLKMYLLLIPASHVSFLEV